ncbi:MAG: Na+/H+ ion antiporter subunit [Rickettsiales bacterium]|nr:Na+/H+ ion antiporter subunit [Rickettsiales bacterium]
MIAQNRIQFPLYTSLRMLTYTLWLIREIIYSSINVAQAIWQLSLIPSPVLGSVKATQKNEVGLTLFANSITLTPGTVSIIVEKNKILVHALEEEGFEALREGEMDRRVTGVTG